MLPCVTPAMGSARLRTSPAVAALASAAVLAAAVAVVLTARALRSEFPSAPRGGVFDVAVVAALALHELLHAAAFLWAGARVVDLRFTASLRRGAAYVGCRTPVTARAYRGVALLPGVVLGALPLVAGLALASYDVALFGALLLGAAGGDLYQVWLLRGIPAAHRVAEDPADPHVMVVGPWPVTAPPPA